MRTFQLVIRDVENLFIETYIIQGDTPLAAMKTAKTLWGQAHPNLRHKPMQMTWNEIPTTVHNMKPKLIQTLPTPAQVAAHPTDAFKPTPKAADKVIAKPTPDVKVGSGIFVTVDGKQIELELTPTTDY